MGRAIAALWLVALACGGGSDAPPAPAPAPVPEVAKLPEYQNCGPHKTYVDDVVFVEVGARGTLRFHKHMPNPGWVPDIVLPIPHRPLAVALQPGLRYRVTWHPGCEGRLSAIEPID
jgi:hypothetical protein